MLNKATLIGRIGKTPEVIKTKTGFSIANFSVATSEKWKDKNGDKKENTEWHNIVCFDKIAEVVGQYVMKGDLIYIEGKIKTEKYKDKEGAEKYSTKIQCTKLAMLGGKEKQEEPNKEELPISNVEEDAFPNDDVPL